MESGTDVRKVWERLDAWVDRSLPELRKSLYPGVSQEELDQAETELGRDLPESVRRSFEIRNGQDERGSVTGLIFGLALLPLSGAMEQWRGWVTIARDFADDEGMNSFSASTPEGAIQLQYASGGWFPLTHDAGGNHIGVDLDPGLEGTYGQVIVFGRDEDHKYVIAPDWATFLGGVARELESGNFEIGENGWLGVRDDPVHYHDHLARTFRNDAT